MSLGTTEGWPGAVIFGNWSVDSLSICHFTTSASIMDYWQGMMQDLIDFLELILLRTYWCPHHNVFRNHRGVAWCCYFWQLVSGQFEYMPPHYKCFHHGVFARNGVRFDKFPGFDLSENILVLTPLWIWEPQRSGLTVTSFAVGIWTVWVYATSLHVPPSLSIGKECSQFW